MQSKNTLPVNQSKITDAWEALGRGDRERAHQISTQILGIEPDNTDAWLLYAKSAASKEEEFEYLIQAQQFFPDNSRLKAVIYQELKNLLEQDPFLAYQGETDNMYRVYSREATILEVPKGRAQPEPYPPVRPPHIQNAYRLLAWAVFGLFLSGLGAVILAPAAGIQAWHALQENPDHADRARAGLILALAVGLAILGLGLVYLLWLHVEG